MSEIKTNKKVATIMPGLDSDGSLIAYPIQNTIIAGKPGSGVNTLINSIITHMVQFNNPNDLAIELLGNPNASGWQNPKRTIPFFKSFMKVSSLYNNTTGRLEDYVRYIHDYPYLTDFDDYGNVTEQPTQETRFLIINDITSIVNVDNPGDADHHIMNMIHYIARDGHAANVYIMLVCDRGFGVFNNILDCFNLRLTTVLGGSTSNLLMGCNLSAMEEEVAGMVWVSTLSDPFKKIRLDVKFYPDTFINKFCKYYSTTDFSSDFTIDDLSVQYREDIPASLRDLKMTANIVAGRMVESDGWDYTDCIRFITNELLNM